MLIRNIIDEELVVSFVKDIVVISIKSMKINKGWLYVLLKLHTLLRKCTENLKFIEICKVLFKCNKS